MVRLSESAYKLLRQIAEEDGISLQAAADAAIDEYDRQRFFEKANTAYRRLRNDPEAWEHELRERRELEGTLMDDIDDAEDWTEEYNALMNREKEHA